MNSKFVEYNRYNSKSLSKITSGDISQVNGYLNFPAYIQAPYVFYEEILKKVIQENDTVLELCAGDGVHTLSLAKTGAKIISTDIADQSVKLAKMRMAHTGFCNVQFDVVDAENLPFEKDSFEVITCVGSLSYLDLEAFVNNVQKVMKGGGKLIIVDSFNHNPVYRLNRYINYLLGRRSLSTIERMPNLKTLHYFKNKFKSIEVRYFGIFTFLGWPLSILIGSNRAANVVDQLDKRMVFLKKHAFKIVFIAEK